MTTLKATAVADLKSYLERVERLEEDRAAIADDIRSVYADAKANGFTPKAIRAMVKRRRAKDPNQAAEDDTILETYMHAVGMLPENPLAVAVAALVTDTMARDQVIDAFKQLVPMHGEIIAKVGGDAMRIWRDETGAAYAEIYVEPKAKPAEKTGKALKHPATVLSMVPRDPVKDAADRAERRGKLPEDEPTPAPSAIDPEPVE